MPVVWLRDGEALQGYRSIADQLFHSGAPAHLRLAEIYERQGERQKAAEHYASFAELWKDSDPEFRPLVEDARRRVANGRGGFGLSASEVCRSPLLPSPT